MPRCTAGGWQCFFRRTVPRLNASPNPQALVVDSGNHKVFIANTHAGTVAVLNGTNETVVGSLRKGRAPSRSQLIEKTHKAVALDIEGELIVIDGTTFATSLPPNSR